MLFLSLLPSVVFAQGKFDAVRNEFVVGTNYYSDDDRDAMVSAMMLRAPFVPDYGEMPDACPEVQIPAQDVDAGGLRRITADCPGRPVEIQPAFSVSGGQPTGYSVVAIPYNPPKPATTDLSTITDDDKWATVQQLPFGFCFYENTYTQVAICANGILSFNASKVSGRDAGWRLTTLPPIPSTLYNQEGGDSGYQGGQVEAGPGYDWRNAIYGVFEDVDPSRGGTIRYGVIGKAPCRKMVVMWERVPLYNTDRIAKLYETFSIVLYEGTNVIDVYVGQRNYDPDWNNGYGIIGVQNAAGTKATAAPGRNNGDVWSTVSGTRNTPEAWRFIPQTTGQAQYTMEWYRGQGTSGQYLGNGDSYTFTPRLNVGMRDTVTVKLSIKSCNGDVYDLQDTAEIAWPDIDDLIVRRDTAKICQGSKYEYRGKVYSEPGNYYAHGPADECDDPSVLTLIINPVLRSDIYATICKGEPYTYNGVTHTEPNDYQYYFSTAEGCDSIVTLHLANYPTYDITTRAVICDNEKYKWEGDEYDSSCEVTKKLKTIHGCDSVVTLILTVNPTFATEFSDTICDNEVYRWQGTEYTKSGNHKKVLQSVLGCDSTVTLHLQVNSTYQNYERDTINFNESLTWHGTTYSKGGEYDERKLTVKGCDSITTLLLHQYDKLEITWEISNLCAGDTRGNATIIVNSGVVDKISLDFDPASDAAGLKDTTLNMSKKQQLSFPVRMPRGLKPGLYNATATYYWRGKQVIEEPIEFAVLFPATVLEQKWDDFVGVLTSKYNGGYDFEAFQWYKDGEELVGETHSYIYQPLHYGSAYQCLLTDTAGLQLMTCPLIAAPKAQISLYPTLVESGQRLQVNTSEPATITMCSVLGHQILQTDTEAGTHTLAAPKQRGVYVIRVTTKQSNDRHSFELMVR